jgi:GxxExxY protein
VASSCAPPQVPELSLPLSQRHAVSANMTTIDSQKIGIELKAVASELGACEEQQLRNYMKTLGVEWGLLINFQTPGKNSGKTQLEIKEVKLA